MPATPAAAKATKSSISTAPVGRKLLLKPGQRIALVNAPAGYREKLEPLPEGSRLSETLEPGGDVVIVFVRSEAELTELTPAALEAVKPDGLMWVCYRKGGARAGSDLHRDTLNAAMHKLGWEGVSLVAVDDAWSAMRLRPGR
jgi:hypothetical protein